MTDELERLIRADIPGDAVPLTGVESAVWTRVGERQSRRLLTNVQGAAIAFSLLIGLTNGSLMLLMPRPAPSEMNVFSVATGLSPLSAGVVR